MTIVEDRPVAFARPAPLPPAGTSDTSRWRLPARLARREVRRRPWRTLLVVFLIGVPVAGLVLGDIAYRTDQLPTDPVRELGAASATAYLYTDGRSVDLPALVERVAPGFRANGRLVMWQEGTLPLRSVAQPNSIAWTEVRTVDLAQPLTAGLVHVVEGGVPRSADEAVLSRSAARALGVGVGGVLDLVRPAQTFTVVGITDDDHGLMIAPGFDVDVVQPNTMGTRLLLDGPAVDVVAGHVWPSGFGLSMVYPSDHMSTDPVDLLVGWLAGVMLMAVLGVVVAAAFAVSGRRQLVCIGQLSASGADPAIIRRYLALQGTVSGVVAATGGAVVAVVAAHVLGDIVANDGRLVVDLSDIVVVVLTAVVVATVAAIVPSRSLVRSSVLSALGGRRPVTPVRRRQVPIGVGLLTAGSLGLFVAVSAASAGSGDPVGSMLLGTVAGLATLAGICCVCPVVVDLIARFGGRTGGSLRLATRSLGRHRARSAALLAAVVAITSAGVAVGSALDQALESRDEFNGQPMDRRTVEVFTSMPSAGGSGANTLIPVDDGVRASVERVVGPVRWIETRTARARSMAPDPMGDTATVADPEVLEALGLDAGERAFVERHDAVFIDPFRDALSQSSTSQWPGMLPGMAVPVLHPRVEQGQRLLVSPALAAERNLRLDVGSTFAVLDHDITRDEYDALQDLSVASSDAAYFRGIADVGPSIAFLAALPIDDWSTVARLAVMGALLFLVLAVVAIGMALWAAEGRDERDALVALGAPPGVLARSAALRAWFLATVGAVLGVPFGWWIISVVSSAADTSVQFPWVIAGGVLVAVPVIVASITLAGSAAGQRARRTRSVMAIAD
jgi:putative ABC transport system permease protein